MYNFIGKDSNSTIETLGFILSELNFFGFCYNVVVDPKEYAFQKSKKASKLQFDDSHTIIALNPTCRDIHWGFFNNCITKNKFILNINDEDRFRDLSNLTKLKDIKHDKLIDLFESKNIKTIFIHYAPISHTPGWYGEFVLFSSIDKATLEAEFAPHRTRLRDILQVYSSYFQDQYGKQINPISNLSCLPDKTLEVLALIVKGQGIKEISDELYLTTRGVSYHIDKLKLFFGAKNIANMVEIAKNAKLV